MQEFSPFIQLFFHQYLHDRTGEIVFVQLS